jgi:hypothetical protein
MTGEETMNKAKALRCIFKGHKWQRGTRFIPARRNGENGHLIDSGFRCSHCRTEVWGSTPLPVDYKERFISETEVEELEAMIDRRPLTDEDIHIGREMVEEYEDWERKRLR